MQKTHPSMQWAAVKTHCLSIILPPHIWRTLIDLNDTWYRIEPGDAFNPPTILVSILSVSRISLTVVFSVVSFWHEKPLKCHNKEDKWVWYEKKKKKIYYYLWKVL